MRDMHDEEKLYSIYLNLLPGVGPVRSQLLLNTFGDKKDIYNLSDTVINSTELLSKDAKEYILFGNAKKRAAQSLALTEKLKISLICREDKEYPYYLSQIHNPPNTLYVQGNTKFNETCNISIVGSRRAGTYGRKTASVFAEQIASAECTIVSGLALGIDISAHEGAVKAGKKTIAVLAGNLENPYPYKNRYLIPEILRNGGSIISENPPLKQIYSSEFIVRNRIISGMSIALIVIEAGIKSGTCSTVEFALEQGRDVYAVPGNIDSSLSAGTNNMIKQGAFVITEPNDILQSLKNTEFSGYVKFNDNICKTEKNKESISEEEKSIIKTIQNNKITADSIKNEMNLSVSKTCALLSLLEIKGYIFQPVPGEYSIK